MLKPLSFALAAGLVLLALLALNSACTPGKPGNTHLYRLDLQRSAAYTQRHLLDFNGHQTQAPSTQEATQGATKGATQRPSQREALLLYSHCDLVERGVVNAAVEHRFCLLPEPDIKPSARDCMEQFHHCLGKCNSINGYCNNCEQQGINCLGLQ